MLTHELEAAGIVLVSSGEKTLLLQAREMQHLLTEPPTSFVLIRMSAQTNSSPLRQLGAKLLTWLHGLLGLGEGARPVQEEPAVEEPFWIRMEALLRLAAEAAQRRNGSAAYGTGETASSENPRSNEEELYA